MERREGEEGGRGGRERRETVRRGTHSRRS
jgi:hypothetical protein